LTFESALAEMDSYRYRTIYRYKSGTDYPEEELALEIQAEHSGLLDEPYSPFIEFPSQTYEKSHIKVTDLHSLSQIEAIITEEGIWIRDVTDSGWIELTNGNPSHLVNLAERFSPYEVRWFVRGLIPPEAKMMKSTLTLEGLEVTHRCYKPDHYADASEPFNNINFILFHWEHLFSGLQDAELHVWTSNNDSQLVRLAIKGKHVVDSYFEYGYLLHESPNDFMLWVDLDDVNQPIDIDAPTGEQILLTIPEKESNQAPNSETPFNQIPLPPDAKLISESEKEWKDETWTSIEEEGITPENVLLFRPRDFIGWEYEFYNSTMSEIFGYGWFDFPPDRQPIYETEMDTLDLVHFFAENMPNSGWTLENAYIQFSTPKYFLHFTRDKVINVIILDQVEDKKSFIYAFLPPDDAILETIINGWESFDESNSELGGNDRKTIAFDEEGSVWVGELEAGVSVFDGTNWTQYSNSELEGKEIWAIEFDRDGRSWMATRDALYKIKGEELTAYTFDDHQIELIKDIKIDDDGNVWITGGDFADNKISVFDGRQWQSFKHLNDITAFDTDEEGFLLIANGEGVYSRDGDNWVERFASEEEANNLNLTSITGLQFDTMGRLWIASQSGELKMFDGDSWTSYNPEDSNLDLNMVEDMVLDQMDRVWLVTFSGGVYMFDIKQDWFNFTPDPIGISVVTPEVMKVDSSGRIWIASRHGLAVLTPPKP
jgi:streptogramin lyase